MLEFTFLISTWKIIIKIFYGSIFYVLHRPFNNAFLIRGMDMML
jgi:hypothetical protein